ncbi:branched-chain amino acid ABC transporter permease [Methylobacterium aquaticum]|uniref:branched-chain amino acid ABC transporter permease n=1 Tax=Methylobacterium aquaticum TaxID=270351 RepID=UPI003D16B239
MAATVLLGGIVGVFDPRMAADMLIYLTVAQLWNLLSGYAGLVSVGQQAFVGLGGYAFTYAATALAVPTLAALVLGGVAGLGAAILASVFIFRLKGAYFAIGTWVVAEICRLTVAITPALGGGSGTSLPVNVVKALGASREARDLAFLAIAMALALVTMAGIMLFLRSRYGLALVAVRDSERAAEALGVDALKIKRAVYIGVAFATALLGGLIFLIKLRMTPDAAFSVLDWTAYVLFITIIGGSGRIEGPFIGTVIFFALRAALAGFGPVYLVILGAVAIAVMLFAPGGVWGLIHARTGWELFPTRRRRL